MNKMLIHQICPDENELAKFIEGKLTGERLLSIKKHLESCPLCNESVRMAMELNALDETPHSGIRNEVKVQGINGVGKFVAAAMGTGAIINLFSHGGHHIPMVAGNNLTEHERNDDHNDSIKGINHSNDIETAIHEALDQFWEGHDNSEDIANFGIDADSSSLNTGNSVLPDHMLYFHDSIPIFRIPDNLSNENERLYPHSSSIDGNLNNADMSNHNQHGEMNPIQQQYEDTCAIKSQQLILNDFGIALTEDQLVQISMDEGWYNGNGTAMNDVGNLLNEAGIPTTQMQNANVYNLVSELSQGHKIIVGVDADELWNKGIVTTAKDLFMGDTPNHALIVAGIDTTDPNNVQVMVTDPGNGDYCKSYPLDQFMDAWQDSKCFMTATDIPAPLAYNPEMINFDYNTGHLENIGEMSYHQFANEVMPASFNIPNDFGIQQQFYDDFNGMVNGEISHFSPEIMAYINTEQAFNHVLNTDHSLDHQSGIDGFDRDNFDIDNLI